MLRNLCISLILILISLHTSLMACSCSDNFKRIKSVDDLKDYQFVALVKVTSETINPISDSTPFQDAVLRFIIIEKFKGNDLREVIESDVKTTCDMGIEVGDEWIIFVRSFDNKLTISACDRDIRYRDKAGMRDWHYKRGIQELEDLRQLYRRSGKQHRDGISREYYPDGKVEIEETYGNSLKNGVQTVFHPSGRIWGKQTFVNDSLEGRSEWYYPSGQLDDQRFYRKGFLINLARVYYDTTVTDFDKKFLVRDFYKTEDSLRKTYSRIQVWMEALYDYDGKIVCAREYSRWGNLEHETLYHQEDSNFTSVFYHDNGQVRTIQHHKDHKNSGHYQEYDPDGNPTRSWDYDADGRQINVHIPKR